MEEKIHEQPNSQVHESAHELESPPVKPTSKLSIGFLLAVLVAFIVLAATGTAFYFLGKTKNTRTINPTATPSPSPTPTKETAWKTYTNTKYNYSIGYPDKWLLSESESKNGVTFNPPNKSDFPNASDSITLSVYQKLGGEDRNLAFEEYVKIAGKEIENHNGLASLKKVTTTDGIAGYETTWMVQTRTINGRPPEGGESESSPITYFEIPGDKTSLLHISLGKDEDLNTYEKMLTTLKFTAPPSEPQSTPTPISTSAPIPAIDEESLLKTAVKEASIAKHGGDGSSLEITVSKIEGNYAKGGVSDQDSGGMWFSAKVNGIWKLVWSGNGIISCSDFSSYPDFPSSMLPECYDTAKQDIVTR